MAKKTKDFGNVIGLTKDKLNEIGRQTLMDIKKCDDSYSADIEPAVMRRRESFESDPSHYEKKFPKLSKISDLTSSDVADTIEWALPSLMRIFFAGEDVVTLQGVTEEDDAPAETMQQLINYQLMRHNNFFVVAHDWFKNSLIENVGILKCYWDRQTKVEESYEIYVNQQELMTLKQTDGTKITKVEQKDVDLFRVEYDVISIVKNQPVVETIPVSELRYSPEAKNIDVADFVAHRKLVTADYLRRKENNKVYSSVAEAIDVGNNVQYTEYEQQANPSLNLIGSDNTSGVDKARKKFTLYECYTKLDVNDDGLLEDVIVTMVGTVVLRVDYNTMGRHPFFLLSPIRDPQKVWAKKGICDLISQLQDLKTALLRQIVYNIALSNDKQAFVNVDMLVDVREFIDGKKAVRVQGDPRNAVYWMPIEPLPPQVFQFLEYVESMKESRTGVTRYNQGLDANSLNKMLDINTPVPMADGSYSTMGEIKDGDSIIGGDGNPTTVLTAHPIDYPKKAYQIKFSSGDIITAGGEHLWTIQTQNDKRYNKFQTIDTDSIYELSQKQKQNIYIPRVQRPKFDNHQELPLDPYILGLWLGDGHSWSSRITTQDEETVKAIRDWSEQRGGTVVPASHQNSGLATTYDISGGGLYTILRQLKLMKASGKDNDGFGKKIPDIYLNASYEDRLELMRGLMDTDGCHLGGPTVIFTQKEGQLVGDVVKLIDGLGGWASVSETNPGELAREGVTYYNVAFSIFDNPFKLKEKADKWNPPKRLIDTQTIVSIEPVDICQMRCLTVTNADGLYCVGNRFTITHNTASGINQIMQASNQRLELIARMFSETGFNQLFRHLIRLNQQFMDESVVIRITNKNKTVSPDDLQGEIDIIINAGMGTGGKAQIMQNVQTLLSMYPQMLQVGVASPVHVSYVIGKMVEEMGWKNKRDFSFTPEEMQAKMDQQAQQPPQQDPAVQQAQAKMQMDQQAKQQEFDLRAQDQQHRHAMDIAKGNQSQDQQGYDQALGQQKMSLDQQKIIHDYLTKMKAGDPHANR